MTRDHLKMARKKMFYSSAKATAELGYAPRPVRAAVEDAVAWFRANGMLPAMTTADGAVAVLIWLIWLLGAWPVLAVRARCCRRRIPPAAPPVAVVVPARDEAP